MAQREAIGKKLRFEVFKRDGFCCQYCGGNAPNVNLEVDHVIPVAEDGTNDIDNLITACENCNRGKGARIAMDLVLKWIPWERSLRPPAGLKDYQQAWFWNLLCASFDQQLMQGYLPVSSQLWKIAGAHCLDYWNQHKSEVLAAFEVRRLDNGKSVLFFQPLIDIMQVQAQRLRTKKGVGSPLFSTVRAQPSISQSAFDFELQKQNRARSVREAQGETPQAPVKSQKMLEREECERRQRLTEARKRGLCTYSTHPLESWEAPSAFAAAGD